MKVQLIRNATLRLEYAGHMILIDPYFAPKHSLPSYTGKSPNPMVELPISTDAILEGVELVVVSHLHSDHFDSVAQSLIPKDWLLLCQPENEDKIREKGFQQVTPIVESYVWKGITITRTDGHHGTGEVGEIMGKVSGFVFQADDEPTIYWAGDTVLCDEVRDAIKAFEPDVIITHSCGAMWPDSNKVRELIVMDAEHTVEVCKLAPESIVVATHMEALDHATTTRDDLRKHAAKANIPNQQLRIPDDGETLAILK